MDELINLFAEVLLVLPIIGLVSAGFLWSVFLSDTQRPRSWVLFLLAVGSTIVAVSGVGISVVAIIRLSGESIGEGGGLVLAIVLFILESLPIWYAYQVWKRRRGANSEVDTSSNAD